MSKIPRLYLPSQNFYEGRVALDAEACHYLKRVLRMRPGECFAALDGQSRAWLCALQADGWSEYVGDFPAVPPLSLKLTVGVALCKGSRFESTIERLAELGVATLVPLHTERTERKGPSTQKLERWQEIARSASALAFRLQPMQVLPPVDLASLLPTLEGDVAYCHPGGEHALEAFAQGRSALTLLIGPEGGFSSSESETISGRATQVDLGPLNLRVETAATLAAGMALRLHRAQE